MSEETVNTQTQGAQAELNQDPDIGVQGNTQETESTQAEKTFTQKEVDDIIEKRMARANSKYKEDLEKAVKEAENKAKMSEEQLRKYEAESKDARIKELETIVERGKLEKYAVQTLKEHKIEATEDILSFVVGNTQEETTANIEKFVGITNAQLAAAESAKAKGTTPKNYGANPNTQTSAFDKVLDNYSKR